MLSEHSIDYQISNRQSLSRTREQSIHPTRTHGVPSAGASGPHCFQCRQEIIPSVVLHPSPRCRPQQRHRHPLGSVFVISRPARFSHLPHLPHVAMPGHHATQSVWHPSCGLGPPVSLHAPHMSRPFKDRCSQPCAAGGTPHASGLHARHGVPVVGWPFWISETCIVSIYAYRVIDLCP